MTWKEMVSNAPNVAGVYSVWAGEVLLYVGISYSIKDRLLTHNRIADFVTFKADRVLWIECADSISRHRTEQYLTVKHQPVLCRFHYAPQKKSSVRISRKGGTLDWEAWLSSAVKSEDDDVRNAAEEGMIHASAIPEQLKGSMGTLKQKEFAEKIGVSAPFLANVVAKVRMPDGTILKFLGLEKVEQLYRMAGKGKR